MKARSTRLLILALLVLALPPGATVAACLESGPEACCCAGACPKPVEIGANKDSCCKMTDGTTLPSTAPATTAPVAFTSFESSGDRIDPFVTPPPTVEAVAEVEPVRGSPGPIPLFTLHAAFLI